MGIFDDLDELQPVSAASKAIAADRPKFPCQSCAGTGKYRGARVHQERSECFACGGKGYFFTSAADRFKKKAAAASRKASKFETALAVFEAENEGLSEFITANKSWNTFLAQMSLQISIKGALTAGQITACRSIQAKCAAKDAERAAQREKASAPVDMSSIHAMFDKARESGLKKLVYRAEGLKISPAKDGSANAGALYVKTKAGDYLGKVQDGKFKPAWGVAVEIKATLDKIAANPGEVAKEYGRATGECSCCGRELTDPNSIAAGIGPICASGWFG